MLQVNTTSIGKLIQWEFSHVSYIVIWSSSIGCRLRTATPAWYRSPRVQLTPGDDQPWSKWISTQKKIHKYNYKYMDTDTKKLITGNCTVEYIFPKAIFLKIALTFNNWILSVTNCHADPSFHKITFTLSYKTLNLFNSNHKSIFL